MRDNTDTVSAVDLILCSTLFLILCSCSLLFRYVHLGHILFSDDAYYYFVVARRLVQTGRSSFDGFTLTNGYHPLWMALLVIQYKCFTQSLLITRLIEFGLSLIALVSS